MKSLKTFNENQVEISTSMGGGNDKDTKKKTESSTLGGKDARYTYTDDHGRIYCNSEIEICNTGVITGKC